MPVLLIWFALIMLKSIATSLRIGQQWTVVLNGADVIKEALLKNGMEFANRPNTFSCKYGNRKKDKEIISFVLRFLCLKYL